jgi:hypothetical protein
MKGMLRYVKSSWSRLCRFHEMQTKKIHKEESAGNDRNNAPNPDPSAGVVYVVTEKLIR